MSIEQYTLILKHEMVDEVFGKVQLEEPLILSHAFDRRFCGSSVVLNEMIDHFKHEVLKKVSE